MSAFDRYISREPALTAVGLPEGADALVFSQAAKSRGGRALFVARDDTRAANFKAACQFFAPDMPVLSLPSWDCLPYDRISPSRTIAARRAASLYALANTAPDVPMIIITTASAAMQKVPPRDVMQSAGLEAVKGQELKRDVLETYLSENGYARASTVTEPGDYAVRGGLIDLYPPGFETPIRLDFFGDELESIRSFDVETQRTIETLKSVTMAPVSEVLLSKLSTATFRKNYIEAFGGGISQDPIYAAVSDGIRTQGLEHFLPLFYGSLEAVFDYVGPDCFTAFDGMLSEVRTERHDLIDDYYRSRQDAAENKSEGVYRPLPPEQMHLTDENWDERISALLTRSHSPFITDDEANTVNFEGSEGRSYSAERRTEGAHVFEAVIGHINDLKADEQRILLASWTKGSSDRLGSVFEDHDAIYGFESRGPDALGVAPKTVRRVILPLERGFVFNDLAVISEQDILGDRLVNRGRKKRAKNFIAEATALQIGDLIVHIDHGLGRFLGLKTLDVLGAPHDCLELEYAGEARLFLPVENIELLSRYGSATEHPILDRLGGAAWQSRKAKAKKRLRDMAAELIKIAAKRALRSCESIVMEQGPYNEFCARFPYAETDDQLSAITDILTDLESGVPMDRLICGDVGFGKTEVALRAAFAAVMAGKQVAVIAPTTILARQHFKTFSERFKHFPVKVRQLSRLVSAKDMKTAKEEMASGRCEIVIGTHALLAKNIKFSDLGLLVVDEEQRFGVQHKERLKALRADVHVLTLTATPIPRTLQMALSGIRDLSLIATPPVDRLAVRTYVSPFDTVSLRKAILRERYRGGQTFLVTPRITDIPRLERFLKDEVPEVKYVIAHGQMPGRALEDIMTAFYDGTYDVLLSTSIIESGIDIPSANTMIINRADKFGLAQLYQMRGRVGRSKVRAYAYMCMPEEHVATPAALQRLKILQSLDTLGAGFSLASHDLDMRGGGNPLGEEQSGHIKDLGVELYQHMLEEAVAELREDTSLQDQTWSPQVNAGVAILIPETYIQDLNLRLATYRRISDLTNDEESNALAAELIDRFGPLPNEIDSLLKVMKIKRLCRQAHVEKVDAGPRGVVMTIRHKDVTDPSTIMYAITQNGGWRLRPDQTILVNGNFENPVQRLRGVERAVTALISNSKV